jgi:hypothetical protein
MDVEISVPQAPVALAPGTETRVPVGVCNRSQSPISLRLSVARSRAGAWAYADPQVVDLAPGDRAGIDVIFQPPAELAPTSTLQPFTVQADDLANGVTAGRATGLLAVAPQRRLTATLTREWGHRRGIVECRLSLTNLADAPLTLSIESRVQPPGATVVITPAALDVSARQTVGAHVRLRPRLPLIGAPRRYAMSISCRDAAATDAPPLATVADSGTVTPPLTPRTAILLAVVVLVIAVVCALRLGWRPHLPRFTHRAVVTEATHSRPSLAAWTVRPVDSTPANRRYGWLARTCVVVP